MNLPPPVSVGVPVYNGERFLSETLSNIRSQDFGDIEIVISDNGSEDATEQICRAAAAEDPRIVYVRSEVNRGMGWNYNRTLEVASAPLFMWNPADDLASPQYLSRCLKALALDPESVLAFSDVELIDELGRSRGFLPSLDTSSHPDPWRRIRGYLDAEAWDAIFGVVRTEVLRSVGGMPHMVGDDVVLGVDLLVRSSFAHVSAPLLQRRQHEAQSSEQHDPLAGALQQAPGRLPWIALPHWRINYELYRRVTSAPVPAGVRARCCWAVFTGWTWPKRRRLLGDVRRSLGVVVRRLRQSRARS